MCIADGLVEDIYTQPYPHPYLIIWSECRRAGGPMGLTVLPEPDKGWMDQDAELMIVFEVLDELQAEQRHLEEARTRARQLASEMFPH